MASALFRLALLLLIGVGLSSCARFRPAPAPSDQARAFALIDAIDALSADGLSPAQYNTSALTDANRRGADIDLEARALFIAAAADLATGGVEPAARMRWRIAGPETDRASLAALADAAWRSGDFAGAFSRLAPRHEQYRRLKAALAALPAGDPGRRAVVALNMERWRWMPADPGTDYILVNVPSYELFVYRGGRLADRRRVIVGTRTLPTPQIMAIATGVAFNPTWFVPQSIVAESVGALMRDDPARAAALGYVAAEDGGVRQKPGPANALGRMKLVMPNAWSVFLHDTPGKNAFLREMRALSHGCVRVDGAVAFARNLLGDALSDAEADMILATRAPREIDFDKPLPVYIGYFTAFIEDDGSLNVFDDVYGLDAPLLARFGGDASPARGDAIGALIHESCPDAPEN